MNVEIQAEAAHAVITPLGNLVASQVQDLRKRIKDLIDQGVREIVFDLANVEIVDSLGIGLLIMSHNSLQKLEGRIEVINASQDLLDEFRPMRLERHFRIAGVA